MNERDRDAVVAAVREDCAAMPGLAAAALDRAPEAVAAELALVAGGAMRDFREHLARYCSDPGYAAQVNAMLAQVAMARAGAASQQQVPPGLQPADGRPRNERPAG